jgi:uncharacterized protein (DUF2252 family)
MFQPNPIDLAVEQIERDRRGTARFAGLFERKALRMSASPLAYLRGVAPLFYDLLRQYPELRGGPGGEGWLCGDAHLENFGVYRTEPPDGRHGDALHDDPVAFDLNDFDETIVGPWRLDVLRLLTSLILGGRELGVDGTRCVALSQHLLDAHVAASCTVAPAPPVPAPVRRLLDKVDTRSHRDLLNDRTEVVGGKRRFIRTDRYFPLPDDLRARAVDAFTKYTAKLDPAKAPKDHLGIVDVAFRVAGTGSLGSLRVAVLTTGKGGVDGGWVFDMKEQGEPSAAALLEAPRMKGGERVLAGITAAVERRPRMAGTTELGDSSMFVRRLAPQEDKLNLPRLKAEELEALATYLGYLLGRAHRRALTQAPAQPWTKQECSELIDRAILIAGVHEASYLAMCKLDPQNPNQTPTLSFKANSSS